MRIRQATALLVGIGILVSGSATGATVLINEIDYDQVGTDSTEWVELYNPDAAPQSLADLELVHWNGANCTEIWRVDLDPITIPANGYVVIGTNACATTLVSLPGSIQNGPSDALYVQNRNTLAILHSVEYETPGASVCGSDPTPASDNNADALLSIQLCLGATSVWVEADMTPCAANTCTVSVEGSTWSVVKQLYLE